MQESMRLILGKNQFKSETRVRVQTREGLLWGIISNIFCSFKNMSSRGETSNKEGGEESSLMLQAMQQQFKRMNVVFNDIRDRMDR